MKDIAMAERNLPDDEREIITEIQGNIADTKAHLNKARASSRAAKHGLKKLYNLLMEKGLAADAAEAYAAMAAMGKAAATIHGAQAEVVHAHSVGTKAVAMCYDNDGGIVVFGGDGGR